MKYNISINQKRAKELGIEDIRTAAILDLLMSCPTWSEPITINDQVYYWVARQKICTELPLLNIAPQTAYRYLKKLDENGFIIYKKHGKKDILQITEKGKSYYVVKKYEKGDSTMSYKNTNLSKNTSKSVKKYENNSYKNTTYNNTNINTNTNDNRFDVFWEKYPKKTNKKKAKIKFNKINPNNDLFEKIIFGLTQAKKSRQWLKDNGEYIPNPEAWLNGERWDDEPEIKTRPAGVAAHRIVTTQKNGFIRANPDEALKSLRNYRSH